MKVSFNSSTSRCTCLRDWKINTNCLSLEQVYWDHFWKRFIFNSITSSTSFNCKVENFTRKLNFLLFLLVLTFTVNRCRNGEKCQREDSEIIFSELLSYVIILLLINFDCSMWHKISLHLDFTENKFHSMTFQSESWSVKTRPKSIFY